MYKLFLDFTVVFFLTTNFKDTNWFQWFLAYDTETNSEQVSEVSIFPVKIPVWMYLLCSQNTALSLHGIPKTKKNAQRALLSIL